MRNIYVPDAMDEQMDALRPAPNWSEIAQRAFAKELQVLQQLAPVSRRALVQRINREIAKRSLKLLAARGLQTRSALGDYYLIDTKTNRLVKHDVDVEEYGRKIGALRGFETIRLDLTDAPANMLPAAIAEAGRRAGEWRKRPT